MFLNTTIDISVFLVTRIIRFFVTAAMIVNVLSFKPDAISFVLVLLIKVSCILMLLI
jgi:hypothetical protein